MDNKSTEGNSSFKALDLSVAFNCGLRDKPQGTPNPGMPQGWLTLGYDFRNLKPGVLKVGKVEFEVIDPAQNHGKSIIVLQGNEFLKMATVAVTRKCDWIYLLHGGGLANSGDLGTLTLVYADGDRADVAMAYDVYYTGQWFGSACFTELAVPITIADPMEQDASLYAAAIRNVHPDKTLKQLVFQCNGDSACWMIFAATTGTGGDLLELGRPQEVAVKVDLGRTLGPIRRLHGTNLAAPLKGPDLNLALQELDIPIVRFHDDALANPGMKLVDISMVFPLFSADPQDPANYYFDQTDAYIADCLATGAKISYRLGESIEHTRKGHYAIHPPQDYEKWAEICCNIIAHYNEGWANGFHHNIEYWPIWEEPDTAALWTGSWHDYIRLYLVTAKKIKRRFPKVKVGGPQAASMNREHLREFLRECEKQNAPLDFFAWDDYSMNPAHVIRQPCAVRRMLDEHGFSRTEIQVSEWNYFPGGEWARIYDPQHQRWLTDRMAGAEGAAYICSVLSGWQDTPLDMGNYYVGTSLGIWGLFDPACCSRQKTYYAMKAFNLMTKYGNRIEAKTEGGGDVWTLAGHQATGEVAVLVSCFKTGKSRISINFGERKFDSAQCKVSVIDADHDLAPLEQVTITGNTVTLEKAAGSSVFLVEIAK